MTSTSRPQLIDERQLSEHLNVSVALLRKWRSQRFGIPFVRLGSRRIGYRMADVERYVSEHMIATSEEAEPVSDRAPRER
jgi:hypothetical protein